VRGAFGFSSRRPRNWVALHHSAGQP
jgi:hypothetical protein